MKTNNSLHLEYMDLPQVNHDFNKRIQVFTLKQRFYSQKNSSLFTQVNNVLFKKI